LYTLVSSEKCIGTVSGHLLCYWDTVGTLADSLESALLQQVRFFILGPEIISSPHEQPPGH